MKCSNCGSENVQIQTINEQDYKKGHGCLFTFLFGLYYWTWLIIKWMCKYFAYACYWLFCGWVQVIIAKKKGIPFEQPKSIKRMMQRHGKTYNHVHSYAVCQDCGHREKIK